MTTDKIPWEQDGEEFDADKAKSYLTNLLSDKKKLQDRLTKLTSDSKDKGSRAGELEKENLRLKVQLNTGLSDRQVARLVGSDFDELMADAEAYAEETGIELRSFIEPADAGTPGDDPQGGDGNEGDEQKQINRNFIPPRRTETPEDSYDAKSIISSMEF